MIIENKNINHAMWIAGGCVFYLALSLGNENDYLATCIVFISFLLSILNKNNLVIGWFIAAPYFCQTGHRNSLNIASNISHNLLVPFILIVFIIGTNIEGRRFKFPSIAKWYFAFLIYLVLSTLLIAGNSREAYRQIYIVYTIPFFIYLIITNMQQERDMLEWILGPCLFHCTALTLICVQEYQTGTSFFTEYLIWRDVLNGRVAGPFFNPVILGLFVSFIAYIILAAYKSNKISFVLLWFFTFCLLFIIYATMTRSVWIGFIAGFIYLMYKILEKPKLVLLYSIVIAIILVILFYWSGGNTQIERRISQDTGSIRLLVMYSGLKMFISQPIIGVGFNRFDELNKTFFTNTFGIRFYSNHLITSHQTIVTFLAELGLIGTVLFLVFFCKAVVQVFRVSNNVSSEIEFSIQAFMLVFIINAMLIDMRFFTIAYSLLFMALGITHKYRNIILSNKKS